MPDKQRPPGWWYPWIFVAGMAVVIAVNAVMAYAAVTTFAGLQTENHYRKGLAYNDALAAHTLQTERGWQVELAFAPSPTGENWGTVEARLSDADGAALADLQVTAQFVRPTHRGYDQELALVHQGDGRYTARATVPLKGQWDVRVVAVRGDDRHQDVTRLYIR